MALHPTECVDQHHATLSKAVQKVQHVELFIRRQAFTVIGGPHRSSFGAARCVIDAGGRNLGMELLHQLGG